MALIKISGDLVRLESTGDRFAADPILAEIRKTDDDSLHDLIISAGSDYEAGFRGQYSCTT
ncbi:hypothetical protein ACM258_09890 [Phaeobacter piscinae]|uniref:hypothetical protein n=1 Tax=Phaeobacter piscinae TaxID=1580596 RepID=UPI0039F6D73B